MPNNIDEFKNHSLPLARIKKIMKSDEDVRVINHPYPDDFILNPRPVCQGLRDLHRGAHLPGLGLHT